MKQQAILLSEVGYLMFTLSQLALLVFFLLSLFISIDSHTRDITIKFIMIICYGILTPIVIIAFSFWEMLTRSKTPATNNQRRRLERRIDKTR